MSTTPGPIASLTPDELQLLHAAPFAAATCVALASGGSTDFVTEMAAATRFLCTPARGRTYGPLVAALLPDLQALTPTAAADWEHHYHAHEPSALRAEARTLVASAADLLRRHPDAAAAGGYRLWLMAAARTAALANPRALHPAAPRPEIDPHEQAALDDLALLLLP
jgi:hypothetical protein